MNFSLLLFYKVTGGTLYWSAPRLPGPPPPGQPNKQTKTRTVPALQPSEGNASAVDGRAFITVQGHLGQLMDI